jgi:hypothetical protein
MATESDRNTSVNQLAGSEGTPVFSADHQAIGHVKEVEGAYFKVDVGGRPDYWLSEDEVKLASANQVILTCAKDEIGRYKRDRPGAPAGDGAREAEPKGDIVI